MASALAHLVTYRYPLRTQLTVTVLLVHSHDLLFTRVLERQKVKEHSNSKEQNFKFGQPHRAPLAQQAAASFATHIRCSGVDALARAAAARSVGCAMRLSRRWPITG